MIRHKLSLFIFAIIACFIFIGCEPDSALPQNEVPDTSETVIGEKQKPVKEKEELDSESANSDEIEELSEEDEVDEPNESVDIVDNNSDAEAQEDESENENIQTNQPSNSTEQNEKNDSTQIEERESITVVINGVDQDGNPKTIISPTKLELLDGDNVYSVTIRVLDQFGIQRSIRGSGSMTYVEGINNLYEFDFGPMSGWQYMINGEIQSRSSGVEKVSNGDIVEWKYFLDFTKDN